MQAVYHAIVVGIRQHRADALSQRGVQVPVLERNVSSPGNLIVSRAETAAELLELYRFRYEIYVEELGKSLPGADHKARLLLDEHDTTGNHFLCRSPEGMIVGSARLHLTPHVPDSVIQALGINEFVKTHIHRIGYISKLMFVPGLRGRGGVMHLLSYLYRAGRDLGAQVCFNHCNPNLTSLYERMGLHKFGQPFVDQNVGIQIPMVQILNDLDNYRKARSFLLSHCQAYKNDPRDVDVLRSWFFEKLRYSDVVHTSDLIAEVA